ncbi:hypothetical protein [Stenotrophomonas cyclobalanopsidis]|uniref:hypothetical protein n=1 Tax=Stenotrophomonas cyclobalanopsidis TaxID=2771362 RepID=UPI00345F287C
MRARSFVVLLIVLLLSIGLALLVPESAPYFRALAAVPGIAAVAGALLLLLREELAHQRQLERDSSSNAFHVAAQSHMAKVLFDKHVLFAEAYASAARQVVGKLFSEGPTVNTRNIEALTRVRLEHGLWVSAPLAAQLDNFEMQFIRIGNAMAMWQDQALRPRLPENHLDQAFDLFHEITGLTRAELTGQSPEEHKHNIQIMMTWLQRLLGVEQLTAARERAITDASSANGCTPSAHK